MFRSPLVLLGGVFGVGVIVGGLVVVSWLSFDAPDAPVAPPPVAEAAPTVIVAPELLLIGTGVITGGYFPTGGAICRLINARYTQPYCAAPSSDGSRDNLAALSEGRVHLAIVQSDWQFHAYHGNLDFAEVGPNRDLRSILSLYKEPLTLVARRGADVASVTDLRGKRIGVGAPGSGQRAVIEGLLRTLGWDEAAFEAVRELADAARLETFCAGELDAIAVATGHPSGLVHEATASCDGVLVALADAEADRLIADNPFYAKAVIPGDLYPGNPEPIESIGVSATLVGSSALSPDIVHALVSVIFEQLDDMTLMHPALAGLRAEDMTRDGLTAPLHDGARRYYTERDWM